MDRSASDAVTAWLCACLIAKKSWSSQAAAAAEEVGLFSPCSQLVKRSPLLAEGSFLCSKNIHGQIELSGIRSRKKTENLNSF